MEPSTHSAASSAPAATGPVRTCIGCGAKRLPQQLRRLCLSSEGHCQLDGTGRGQGRGAYVCGAGCLRAAGQRKALGRAFRGQMRGVDVAALEVKLEQMDVKVWAEGRRVR